MENNEITQQEVLKKISEIRKFIKILKSQNTITANQIKALNALFMADEIFTGINRYTEENSGGELEVISEKSEKEPKFEESIAERIKLKKQRTDEQPDTTDMPDLEIEESVAQRGNQQGKGLRILKANQMLIRLPISLVQLKTGNNSQKLRNEIRQLLYSLYRSVKSNKFIYQFTDKLNLKISNNKNIGLVDLSIYYTWKYIKSVYNNNKFKISSPI